MAILHQAFADLLQQDRSTLPIATPNPFAGQPEDIVKLIATVFLHNRPFMLHYCVLPTL